MSIKKTYNLTELEASELDQKSKVLSSAFLDLRNAYSTDHITETHVYVELKKTNAKKKGYRKIFSQAITRLSKKARTMWKAFIAC